MELYSSNKNYKLYQGNMLDMLEVIEPNTIDSIVCDPPYGLTSITKRFGKENSAPAQFGTDGAFSRLSKGFMGKEWDGSGIEYNIDTWKKCYEVLKPGGYLLAFSGSRTFHRIAVAIEDAGFEIRDTIMWLYGSGFPKSMALDKSLEAKITTGSGNKKDFYKCNGILEESKGKGYTSMKKTNVEQDFRDTNYQSKGQIQLEATTELAKKYKGWGTCLKPSFEPIIVARKPFKGSLVDNVIEYGVGGINIDECRVEYEKTTNPATNPLYRQQNKEKYKQVVGGELSNGAVSWTSGKNGVSELGRFPANTILTYDDTDFDEVCGGFPSDNKGQSNSRYFYCAKASKKDRDEGLDEFDDVKTGSMIANINGYMQLGGASLKGEYKEILPKKNTHPTVKPTELMQYLVRLVTPNNGTILDPFNGSGSTGKAVMYENKERHKNYKYIGIELTEEYLPIAKARIEYVCNLEEEKPDKEQLSLFD